jgi:hypothetical protein
MSALPPGSAGALPGEVQSAPSGARGFDCDGPITAAAAEAFLAAGFTFAVRYLSRSDANGADDLSLGEGQIILQSGLALMAVQHVQSPPWTPSRELGQTYGANAAANAQAVGLPAGVNVWLDLEGVAADTPAEVAIDYCNAWFAAVAAAGYAPGLYVGASAILTPDQLYSDLSVAYYWKSLSNTPEVATRGYCMVQTAGGAPIAGYGYDQDTVQTDNLGATPRWLINPV